MENGSLYATLKNAALGVLSEAQERAKIHMDCYGKLHNQVLESIKRWKNQTYHKHFLGHWKETKEVREVDLAVVPSFFLYSAKRKNCDDDHVQKSFHSDNSKLQMKTNHATNPCDKSKRKIY